MLGEVIQFHTDEKNDTPVATWRSYLQEVFCDHGVKSHDNILFTGIIKKRNIAGITFAYHQSTAHTIYRDKKLVKSDKFEAHTFVFPLSGSFYRKQRSREAVFRSDQMYIVNASQPFDVSTSAGVSGFAITLPSASARLLIPGLDDKCIKENVGDPFLVSALTGLCYGIFRKANPIDPLWFRKICCELLSAALDPRFDSGGGDQRGSNVAQFLVIDTCKRCIEERLHDRNFGVIAAAAACGVSVRYLQTVLQGAGLTFGRLLLVSRLKRAAHILRSETRSRKQISDVARECGFSSQSHFSTRYREYWGVSPSDEMPIKGAR